uniref:Phosphoribosyltransferase domain-containing protein n=1 Tax=Meloidogyne incognita TaxID=6306 RepID=A0A914KRY0_MELIC
MENNGVFPVEIGDNYELPLSEFGIPRCYEDNLSAVLIEYPVIQDRIYAMAVEINSRIGDKPLVMICVLKGSFRFFSDLLQKLSEARSNCSWPIRVEFIRARSYIDQKSTGNVFIEELNNLLLDESLKGAQVVLVDDIIDTGLTISKLTEKLKENLGPEGRIWTALLISKRTTLVKEDSIFGDFVGFSVPDKFIVGYGMDYNEMFRDLPHICIMNSNGIEKYRKRVNCEN